MKDEMDKQCRFIFKATFAQTKLTKGADISGGHCRQIDVTVILYVTVMKITLQCKLKNNRRKCPNIGFIFFFPYLYFFF